MSGHTFYIVDVFAEEKYAGNQLAVVRQAAGLSTETMQRLAKEMNYSETTFIDADTRVAQGYEIGRPSLLYLRAAEQGGEIAVSVGGKVVMVAQGTLV